MVTVASLVMETQHLHSYKVALLHEHTNTTLTREWQYSITECISGPCSFHKNFSQAWVTSLSSTAVYHHPPSIWHLTLSLLFIPCFPGFGLQQHLLPKHFPIGYTSLLAPLGLHKANSRCLYNTVRRMVLFLWSLFTGTTFTTPPAAPCSQDCPDWTKIQALLSRGHFRTNYPDYSREMLSSILHISLLSLHSPSRLPRANYAQIDSTSSLHCLSGGLNGTLWASVLQSQILAPD